VNLEDTQGREKGGKGGRGEVIKGGVGGKRGRGIRQTLFPNHYQAYCTGNREKRKKGKKEFEEIGGKGKGKKGKKRDLCSIHFNIHSLPK